MDDEKNKTRILIDTISMKIVHMLQYPPRFLEVNTEDREKRKF